MFLAFFAFNHISQCIRQPLEAQPFLLRCRHRGSFNKISITVALARTLLLKSLSEFDCKVVFGLRNTDFGLPENVICLTEIFLRGGVGTVGNLDFMALLFLTIFAFFWEIWKRICNFFSLEQRYIIFQFFACNSMGSFSKP